MGRLKLAIYLKRVFIFEDITETDAEKFVVHLRHIPVNLARRELHVIFVERLMVNNIPCYDIN